MSTLNASTQYNDDRGTAAITWHDRSRLAEFAESHGFPDEYVPIGIRIKRLFAVNRTDPIEDTREEPAVHVKILGVSKKDIGTLTIPEYFQSREPGAISVKSFSREFKNLDHVFNWFKEIDIVLLTPRLAQMDVSGVRVEDL